MPTARPRCWVRGTTPRWWRHRTAGPLISIDTQVQDQDFRLQWPNGYRTTGFDVGWKAAAQNLSDINAMGGKATSLVVSLTLPPETPVSWVEDLADGLTRGNQGTRGHRTAPWPGATWAAERKSP